MKKIALFILSALLLNACYDDTRIWEELRDHENRLLVLEELCAKMNLDIASIMVIADASVGGDYIVETQPYLENGVEVGYEIVFAKSKSIVIYHGNDGTDGKDGVDGKDGIDGKDGENGKDGKDGEDGKNGTDGRDGRDGKDAIASAPVLGVKTAVDGLLYWTVNGAWLLDDMGEKVAVVGTVAKDGVTPKLKIEDGGWFVTYDDGLSWERLGDVATGDDQPSSDASPLFQSVDITDPMCVVFTLTSGEIFTIPTEAALDAHVRQCNQMNDNIEALHAAVLALQTNDYIVSVEPLVTNGKEMGYVITFAKAGTITLYHGRNGADGAGATPRIGLKQDIDGIYYWTLNDEWLLDENGQKVSATGPKGDQGTAGLPGEDGQDGTPGTPGKDGQDGAQGAPGKDGQDGTDGKDGVTPQLKIENGYWFVSYNNGVSWTQLGVATDGSENSGSNVVSSPFVSVDITDDYISFTLTTGEIVQVPTKAAFDAHVRQCNVMNTNIASLQAVVDALYANDYVTSVQPYLENGKEVGYVISFAKSNPIVIYHGKDGADGANGSDGSSTTPDIGLKKDTDGVYYWTLNGSWLLDSNGQKVSATGPKGDQGEAGRPGQDGQNGQDGQDGQNGVDGVTPQLKIENGYWMISYNSGISWDILGQATGGSNQGGSSSSSCIISGIKSDVDTVTITLVDGSSIVLPKAAQDQSVFDLSREKLFIVNEETKTVEVTMQNVTDVYVMTKPDGWKAVLKENILTVTAPTKTALEIGAGDESGEIVLHATTASGACKTVKLSVSTGPGLVMDVDRDGNVRIENSYTGISQDMWGEGSTITFKEFAYGIAAADNFLASPEEYIKNYNTNYDFPSGDAVGFAYNIVQMGIYEEGVYETDVISSTVEYFYENSWIDTSFPSGKVVFWVAPLDDQYAIDSSNILYMTYVKTDSSVSIGQVTCNDVTFTLDCVPADSYVIGCLLESSWKDGMWGVPTTFEEFVKSNYWTYFVEYQYAESLGLKYTASELPSTIKLSEIAMNFMGLEVCPGTTYNVWVMPMYNDKKYSDYDFDEDFMPYVMTVTTLDYEPGGNYDVNCVNETSSYNSVSVDVRYNSYVNSLYYAWYTLDEFNNLKSQSNWEYTVYRDFVKGYGTGIASGVTVTQSYLDLGETAVLVLLALGKDGKYQILSGQYTTLSSLPATDKIKLECVSVTSSNVSSYSKSYTVKVRVTGAEKVLGYRALSSFDESTFLANVCGNGHKETVSSYQIGYVDETGCVELTYTGYFSSSTTYYYYVAAVNVEDGLVSEVSAEYLKIVLE